FQEAGSASRIEPRNVRTAFVRDDERLHCAVDVSRMHEVLIDDAHLRDVGPVALGLRRQLTVAFVADQLEPRVPRRERAMNSGRASTPSACVDLDDESEGVEARPLFIDRKSTRLNSSHVALSYAVFC